MIAVLTTVRNGMPFLAEAIASVRRQRYDDFRHYVVDDGSTDGTSDFLVRPENADLAVLVGPPQGRGRALNLGWRASESEIIAILDADDMVSPAWLDEMATIMTARPEIAVLSCRGAFALERVDSVAASVDDLEHLGAERFLSTNPVCHSGTLIRRTALLKAGGYDETRVSLFDYALWVKLLGLGEQIWQVDRGYVYKRIHPRQSFENRKRLQYLQGCYALRRQVSAELLGGRGALLPPLAFAYGLLPQRFRHWFRYWRHHGNAAEGGR